MCLPLSGLAELIHGQDTTKNTPPVRTTPDGQVVNALGECEDDTNNLCRVEHYYSYSTDDADIVVKASAGFVHSIQCWPEDSAATAGSVALRDATSAGSGTIVWGDNFAAAEHTPSGGILDYVMATGIVIDFTTTDDVFCTVSYR
jgi:hypothetical protein